jgi:hypothetical protein
MRKSWLWYAAPVCGAVGMAGALGAGAVACSSNNNIPLPGPIDSSTVQPEASTSTDGGEESSSTAEAGSEAGSDAAPPTPSLLFTNEGTQNSQIAAFVLASNAVGGRIDYADPFLATYTGTTAPWLLGEQTDVVARLDGQKPWVIDAAWNVALNDYAPDAGFSANYSDPQAVIVGGGTQAYVLRYTRNRIAIIDTAPADGGASDAGTLGDSGVPLGVPVGSIDLSSELQAAGDGYVQPIAGVYVASQQRVYVVLGNINRNDVANGGYNLECANTTATIIAIDTTSNTLVDLNGSAAGNGWALPGYDPILGQGAIAYDPATGANGRILVLEAGCNQVESDGGLGPLVKSEVDAIDLATGTASKLVDLSAAVGGASGFPAGLAYIGAHQAIVFFYGSANAWDPTTDSLGASIPNVPDTLAAYGGNGNLVGLNGLYAADGGFEGYGVVSVAIADGGVTTLGPNPFTVDAGYPTGVTPWPAP